MRAAPWSPAWARGTARLPIGILTGLGSGLGYALYSIFAKFALARYSPITVTAYTFVFASLGITPLCAVSQFPALVSAQPASLPWMIGLGLLCSALPYLLYTSGLSRTEPGKASILASVEPVVATLLGILVFGEPLTLPGLLGVAAVFASLVILSLPSKARTSSPSTGRKPKGIAGSNSFTQSGDAALLLRITILLWTSPAGEYAMGPGFIPAGTISGGPCAARFPGISPGHFFPTPRAASQ